MWTWIEKVFRVVWPCFNDDGPMSVGIADWINEIESANQEILDLKLTRVSNGTGDDYIIAVVKVRDSEM